MTKKKLRNIFLITLLCHRPFFTLFGIGRTALGFFSPQPIVFSVRTNKLNYYRKTNFTFYTKNSNFGERRYFDKEFYTNLGGPHRIKIFYVNLLKSNKILMKSYEDRYQKIFCSSNPVIDAFRIKGKITKVIVHQSRMKKEFLCQN